PLTTPGSVALLRLSKASNIVLALVEVEPPICMIDWAVLAVNNTRELAAFIIWKAVVLSDLFWKLTGLVITPLSVIAPAPYDVATLPGSSDTLSIHIVSIDAVVPCVIYTSGEAPIVAPTV